MKGEEYLQGNVTNLLNHRNAAAEHLTRTFIRSTQDSSSVCLVEHFAQQKLLWYSKNGCDHTALVCVSNAQETDKAKKCDFLGSITCTTGLIQAYTCAF